jgi:hypothetical protein
LKEGFPGQEIEQQINPKKSKKSKKKMMMLLMMMMILLQSRKTLNRAQRWRI